ncbi:tyrosine-type recombinase/integrase [Aeromonas caviae]
MSDEPSCSNDLDPQLPRCAWLLACSVSRKDASPQSSASARRIPGRILSGNGVHRFRNHCSTSPEYAAVNLDLIELNPARTIKPSTIGAEAPPPRQRWLCREEIALFWLGLNEGGYHPAQVNCLRLILLTGARRGEATSMTWDQIIGNKWVIPASNAKNGKEHTITLHPLALDVIASQRAISRGSAWVFEAIREHDAGQGHIDGNALRWVLNKVRALTMPQSEIFTVHDLRRTFASCCAEYLDANESVIELALNHSKRDRLVATYQAGKRAEQVARLFELWGDFVFTLIKPAQHKPVNVISVDFRNRN